MIGSLLALAGLVVIAVALVSFLLLPWYLRRHPEKRGASAAGSGVIGAAFDGFNPSGAEARAALDEQQRLVVPAPTPDGDLGISDGRIRIQVPPPREAADKSSTPSLDA